MGCPVATKSGIQIHKINKYDKYCINPHDTEMHSRSVMSQRKNIRKHYCRRINSLLWSNIKCKKNRGYPQPGDVWSGNNFRMENIFLSTY